MKINQLKAGVVLSYLHTIIHGVISIVYTPVMLRLLGQSEYGVYTLVSSVVSYLSLFNLGFTGTYLRFYSQCKSGKGRVTIAQLNGMFFVIFGVMSLAALICGGILAQNARLVFGDKLAAAELETAKVLLLILTVNVALTFPNSLMTSMTSAHEEFIFQRLVNLLGLVFDPLLCLPLLLMGYGSVAMVCVATVITVAKLAINAYFCFRKLHIPVSFRRFEWKMLQEMLVFSVFVFINMLVDQLNWNVDKIVLSHVAGSVVVAIYGVGSQFNTLFCSFGSAISAVFAPRVNRIVAEAPENLSARLTDLLIKVGRIQYMLVLYVLIGFIFCGRPFINWWAGEEYAEAYLVALLLIFPLLLSLPRNLGNEIRRAMNRHQIPTMIMLGTAAANTLVSIPLAIQWGAVGAALGTFVCLLINIVIIDAYYVRKLQLDMKRFYKNLLEITKVLLIPILVGLLGGGIKNWWFRFAWIIPYSVLYFGFLYRFGMDESEKNVVITMLRKVRGKRN